MRRFCGILRTTMSRRPSRSSSVLSRSQRGRETRRALIGFLRYVLIRSIAVGITVVVGVYLAIWISNLGGVADQWHKDAISEMVLLGLRGPAYSDLSAEEFRELVDATVEAAYAAHGFDRSFVHRSFQYLAEALSLSFGDTRVGGALGVPMRAGMTGSTEVRDIILEPLPRTVLLFCTATLLSLLLSLFGSLFLTRRYGNLIDRLSTLLIPVFAAPPWLHGVVLIVLFASVLRILPYGGVVDAPPPDGTFAYLLSVLKHMILPVMAWVLATLPMTLYANRAFFLIHSKEDYVELARAKGLRVGRIQRRYLLRPVLPAIITQFTLTLIASWQGAILVETVFGWPGIGSLLYEAVYRNQVPVVIGTVTVFALLLGISVIALDVVYALVDPRVRIGGGRKR